jgi:nicotinamide-nucleotide amidase
MDAEIITIGEELITGHTADRNGAFVAQSLTDLGFSVKRITSVGDSVEAMEEVFRDALRRVRVVIATGGLGPTDDDITKKAIVRLFKRNLIFHEDILEDIRRRYAERGIDMPAINQNQALLPQGAELFTNRHGSALGICICEKGHVFVALPGVPVEMRQIMTDSVIPYLRQLKQGRSLFVRKLRTTGIIESRLAEMIVPGLKLPEGVRLAYLPAYSGVDLRLYAEADSELEAREKVQMVERHLEKVCGKYVYGYDLDTLEGVIGQLLADNDKTLSVAESCTGGELGSQITSVPGASAYFVGGILAYSNHIKTEKLGVSPDVLQEYGAVSEECARAMAEGCRTQFATDYAIAITGIAGPEGGTRDKPVGTIYIAVASAHNTRARLFRLGGDRAVNRHRSVYAAMEMLRREILDIE